MNTDSPPTHQRFSNLHLHRSLFFGKPIIHSVAVLPSAVSNLLKMIGQCEAKMRVVKLGFVISIMDNLANDFLEPQVIFSPRVR